ncbi:MAG: alanine racemase [Actinomycetota bacterium]
MALVEEGIAVRAAGIDAPLLVLSEFPRGAEADALARALIPTLCTPEGLAALGDAADAIGQGRDEIAVHVKVDTGMHRIGVWPPEDLAPFVRSVRAAGFVVEGVWTHLACAEDDDVTTKEQLQRFEGAVASLDERPPLLHAANSAATILYPDSHLDLVRPGIAIYGIEPAPGIGADLGLRPALSWHSAVSMVKRLPAGEAVSYGHLYRLDRDATIATVPVGYEDGFPRALSSVGQVLVGGVRRHVAGTVTMDQILLDCGDDPVRPGDPVVVIGRQGDEEITAAELAEHAGSIAYEIVTAISERVPREYVG